VRIRIHDLVRSEFVRSESDFEPNYVLTPTKRKIHRVKIVGTVRSDPIYGPDGSYARFLFDDSTAVIWVSAFHTRVAMVEELALGDMIQLVATVNEYRENLELIVDCLNKVGPNFWLLHRAEVVRSEIEARKEFEKIKALVVHERNLFEAKEVAREIGVDADTVESLGREIPPQEENEEDLGREILDIISRLDAGGGVPLTVIIESLKGSHSSGEIEAEVIRLMEEGEIYEPVVGRYARI